MEQELNKDFTKMMERLMRGEEWPRDYKLPCSDDELNGC